MKVPPKRKGNSGCVGTWVGGSFPLNESPSEKEGKSVIANAANTRNKALNESPSEKEGKCF